MIGTRTQVVGLADAGPEDRSGTNYSYEPAGPLFNVERATRGPGRYARTMTVETTRGQPCHPTKVLTALRVPKPQGAVECPPKLS